MFEIAYKESKNPICYNGDIVSVETYNALLERFPELPATMIGRGIISNPNLISQIINHENLNKTTLLDFHNEILDEYIKISSGDRNVLFKMKELWFYMITLFDDADKIAKKIKKVEKVAEYEKIISMLFDNCALREGK